MIIFIYGTTAEAIKLAPIARRLDEAGIPHQHWLTLQHTTGLLQTLPQLGLPEPDHLIANGRKGESLKNIPDVLRWLMDVGTWVFKNSRRLRATLPSNTVVLVHGDTMTSVVGAWIARVLRVKSAHVEAGLRSGNWRHPFPEELDRRMVGAMATIHYPPSEEAALNLRRKKNVVFTHGNTVIDAVLDQEEPQSPHRDEYGVVLLHRFEFISNQSLVEQTLRTLLLKSRHPLRFVVDAYARATLTEALSAIGLGGYEIVDKLRHQEFINLIRGAEFMITDSGGIQEETALIGVPTLVHRIATERSEGLGSNVVLSGWNADVLASFLEKFESFRRPTKYPERSPSDVIVDDLVSRGFAD